MLISESQIFDPLKDSIVLDENLNYLPLIPVVENTRLGVNLVRLEDLNEDVSLKDIADYNGISIDSIAVVVDEGTIIENPELASYFPCVIEPLSENCYESKLVDYLCGLCEENYDETYLDLLTEVNKLANVGSAVDLSLIDNRMTPQQRAKLNAKGAGLLAGTLTNLDNDIKNSRLSPYTNTKKYYDYIANRSPGRRFSGLPSTDEETNEFFTKLKNASGNEQYKTMDKVLDNMGDLYKEAMHVPTSKIGKFIARLRNAYHSYLLKADRAIDMKKAGLFRKIAAKILTIIDKLAAKLQRAAG